MSSKPNDILNHHMKLHQLASCLVWKSLGKAKLHHENINCSWVVTPLPYQHWILSRDLSLEQLRILGTEMVFALPRCFLLRMMCPLHLHELDGLVASLALGSLKNTDWTLRVGKVRTQLDLSQVNNLLWLLEALL